MGDIKAIKVNAVELKHLNESIEHMDACKEGIHALSHDLNRYKTALFEKIYSYYPVLRKFEINYSITGVITIIGPNPMQQGVPEEVMAKSLKKTKGRKRG